MDTARIKEELGLALQYPDTRAGLRAILAAGGSVFFGYYSVPPVGE